MFFYDTQWNQLPFNINVPLEMVDIPSRKTSIRCWILPAP